MRRDTPENWVQYNPVLADGEFGVERTPESVEGNPSQFKIGDGVTPWTELTYAGLVGKDGIDGVDGTFTISPLPDNRAKQDPDDNNSLYVPELQVDLVDIYNKVKADQEVDLSGLSISEKTLADLTVVTGTDTRVIVEDLGKSVSIKKIAGETLSALTCVYERDGVVNKLDYRDSINIDYFLGITTTAGNPGDKVTVQRLGQMSDNFWNLSLDRVYLGANGSITQTPPEDGYDVLIGMATNPKTIVFNIQDPIELEN